MTLECEHSRFASATHGCSLLHKQIHFLLFLVSLALFRVRDLTLDLSRLPEHCF